MAEFVSVQSSAGLATIRLDRPPVNALSIALQGELRDAAEQVSADPDIRAAVIYGGEKVFAAGAFTLAGSVRQPQVETMLENLWTRLTRP